MGETRERKSNLVTVRMDDAEKETLEYLSDRMDRSRSDTIIRACKFFSSVGGDHVEDSGITRERVRRGNYIHVRVTDSDMEILNNGSRETNRSVSDYVRGAIKAYYGSITGI